MIAFRSNARSVPIKACATLLLIPLSCAVLAADIPSDARRGSEQPLEATAVAGDAMGKSETHHQTLLDRTREQGRIPVIVRLAMDLIPEAALDAQGIQAQRDRLATMQQRVLERLSSAAPLDEAELGVKRFALTPALALQVDARELQALLADPEVVEITEDHPAVLFNSIN